MAEAPKAVNNLRKSIILILLGLFVLSVVLRFFVTYRDVLSVILQIGPIFIILAFATKILSLLVFNYKVYILSKSMFKVSFWKLLPIHMAGALMNNLTPGPSVGGEPLKAYYLSEATGKRGSACLGLYVMDSLIFVISTAIFMFLSTFYLISKIKFIRLKYFLVGWLVLSIIIAFIVLWAIFKLSKNKKRFNKILKFIYKFPLLKFLKRHFKTPEDFIEEIHVKRRVFIKTLKALWVDKPALFKNLVLSSIWYPLQALGLWLLFLGLGFHVPFLRLLSVTTISMSLGFFIWLPGGSGIYEGAVILLMTLLGAQTVTITATTIIDRAGYYVLTYLVGYFCLSYIAMKYGKGTRRAG